MMRNPNIRLSLDAKFTLELNEAELGALDAIFGYSPEHFLTAFSPTMNLPRPNRPPSYREESAEIYLARQRRIENAKGLRNFKIYILILLLILATYICLFSSN